MSVRSVGSDRHPRNKTDFVLRPFRFMFRSLLAERWNNYAPRVRITLENERFFVKTAETWEDVEPAFLLRHSMFLRERFGQLNLVSNDFENDDIFFDHIVITEKATGRCAGACRLKIVEPNAVHCSAAKFSIGKALDLPGVKIEVGRACVPPDCRELALYRTLAESILSYMDKSGCGFMFGCSPLNSTEKETIARIHRYLSVNNHLRNDLDVRPHEQFQIPHFSDHIAFIDRLAGDSKEWGIEEVPQIMEFYLRCGARFCGEPAIHNKTRTTDFFMIIDRVTLSKSLTANTFSYTHH